MRISELGEFPLIERLQGIVEVERADIIEGMGDDVAVLACSGDDLLLATMDIQMEEVHFLRDRITPQQLGRRALAINLSDIAAMGGAPQFALVSLALPTDTEVVWVEALYQGLREEADRYGVAVVGGNMSHSPDRISVDITVLGRVAKEHLLLRSGAQPGDQLLVTGSLGEAAAGLQIALNPELSVSDDDRSRLLARLLTPQPRLPEAAAIARTKKASAMIDISDGLSSDVAHICDRSKVGVRIWAERLPIRGAVHRVAAVSESSPWQLALTGGEDYELCFTAPASMVEELVRAVREVAATPVTVVGEILPAEEGRWLVMPDGQTVVLEAGGWRHF